MKSSTLPVILGFDTTLMALSAAVIHGDDVLASQSLCGVRDHAERLPGLIATVIEAAGRSFAEIERIAVTVGPGGFSGLRVGLSQARGMAVVLGCPVIGIGTLEALAAGSPGQGPVIAAIDARRGEIYVQAFDAGLLPLTAPRAQTPQSAAQDFAAQDFAEQDVEIAGTGRQLLFDAFPSSSRFRNGGRDFPDAADIARLASRRTMTAHPPRPLYIRPPDAKLPATATRLARS